MRRHTYPLRAMVLVACIQSNVSAQTPGSEALETLAIRVAGAEGTPVERTRRLVTWLSTELAWTTTDYERRTVDEIIARRGGNCAELARVLARLLDLSGVRYRTVREINIQPDSGRRQASAEARVRSAGPRMSVFGRLHNDHVWLEVADGAGGWVPADPSVGSVGFGEWMAARAALQDRRPPAVPAAAPIVAEMLVPIAVLHLEPYEDRSEAYLVAGLDRAYGARLSTLPAWSEWVRQVRAFAPLARGAFAGTVNLHEHAAAIDALGQAYRDLQRQAAARGIRLLQHGSGVGQTAKGSDPGLTPV